MKKVHLNRIIIQNRAPFEKLGLQFEESRIG